MPMISKKMRDVAQADLPADIFSPVPTENPPREETTLTECDDLDKLEDWLEGGLRTEEDEFYPHVEVLARHLGRLLRQSEGVELQEFRDVFGHEWGWSIDLRFHSIPYSLLISESAPMSDHWRILLRCHAGWFDRWFNHRLIRFCDEHLCGQVKAAMLEYPGIDVWEWQTEHLPESIS
jgi:hypothetical protein